VNDDDRGGARFDPDDQDLGGWCPPVEWGLFWTTEDPVNEWEIEPIVPARRIVSIWARAKVGKSLLLLDVAAAAASGTSILGQPQRDPIEVVYVDLEMSEDDLRERMEDLGYSSKSDLARLHYYRGGGLPPMDSPLGGDVIAAICQKWSARLLVVDTMARAVNGKENESDTYRNFHTHTGLKLRALGVSTVLVDNGGKDTRQGQRGSSAKEDGVDVVFAISQPGDLLTLRCTHTRVPWVPSEVHIQRQQEPLLRHVLTPITYPAGTAECAELLDKLDVPLDAGRRSAEAALKDAGQGRGHDVVTAALKYRRRPR
jgi:hypothetical protein